MKEVLSCSEPVTKTIEILAGMFLELALTLLLRFSDLLCNPSFQPLSDAETITMLAL